MHKQHIRNNVRLIINVGFFSIIDIASQFLIRPFIILACTPCTNYNYSFNVKSINVQWLRIAFLEYVLVLDLYIYIYRKRKLQ